MHQGRKRSRLVAAVAVMAGLGAGPPAAHERAAQDGWITGTHEGAHGTRDFLLYEPPAHDPGRPAPLVVMLHGCLQDAADFARGTRLDGAAAEHGVLLLYPEQPASANPNRCWNWYEPAHQRRGAGEPALLAGLVRRVAEERGADPERIYVAGLSAGGAMALVLAAAYPELFAAVGVHSGVEYRAAGSVAEAFAALRSRPPEARTAGDAAYAAMGDRARPVPAIVVHGTADGVVAPENAARIVAQWTEALDLADDGEADGSVDSVPDAEERGAGERPYVRRSYRDAGGAVVLELWLVDGLGHAWSGGSPEGSFTDPAGPDAGRAMLRFFLARTAPGRPAPGPGR